MTVYDVFFSYRRQQAGAAEPWIAALRAAGVEVWQDTRDLELLTDFSAEIADALSASKALLVWYSADYAESIPCQWELTAAFIAAQRDGQPMRRIFVVNPEADAAHIVLPAELAACNYINPANTTPETFVDLIRGRLRAIVGPFGAVRPTAPPTWLPHKPAAAPYFLGRHRDMWRLQSKLLIGSESSITAAAPALRVVIRGLGGMGKTLLAQQYALRFGWAWPGGIYWFNAYGGNTGSNEGYELRSRLEQQLYDLAKALDINTDHLDLNAVKGRLRRVLEDTGQAYLWIVDDVPPGVPIDELGAWSALTARGKTLVTTRSRQYSRADAELDLVGLDAKSATALLTSRRAPRGESELAVAAEIVGLLGGHAQALEVAAAAVAGSFDAAPYSCLLTALQAIDDDALECGPGDLDQLPTGHDRSVARTLLGSINLLDDMARQVLFLAATLGSAPIPVGLLSTVLEGRSCTRKQAEQAVTSLETHALAAFDRDALSVTVHPIVNYVVRHWRDAQSAIAEMRPLAVVAVTAALSTVEDIRTHRELEFHVLHGRVLAQRGETIDDAALMSRLATHDSKNGAFAAARALGEAAVAIRRRVLGEEHPDTLITMGNLASTLGEQGDFAAARLLQETVLAVFRRAFGDEHLGTLSSMNNLATTLNEQGDSAAARTLFEQVLSVRRRVLGGEHSDTLTLMNNLAGALQAQGDLAAARALQEEVLSARRRVFGDEHPDTLIAVSNLASMLTELGDLAAARELEEQALVGRRRVLGDEHPDTLLSMGNLAGILTALGDLVAARAFEEQVLAGRHRVLGDEHPATLTAMNNLAVTYWDFSEHDEAYRLMQMAADGRERLLGQNHPHTVGSREAAEKMRRDIDSFSGTPPG